MEWSPQSTGSHTSAGLRHATHWLFSRLAGAEGVNVPDTAVFDGQGILETWVCTSVGSASSKSKQRSSSYRVAKRNPTELNLLRFEAHLQDTGVDPNGNVAVAYDGEFPRTLDEAQLDSFIRVLCARERSLTSAEPDLSLPLSYPGGGFTLQAVAGTPKLEQEARIRTTFMAVDENLNRQVEGHYTHEVKRIQASDARTSEAALQDGWKSLLVHTESQTAAIVKHLFMRHRVHVQRMELCFVMTKAVGIQLTCAEFLEWREVAQTETHRMDNNRAQRRAIKRDPKCASRRGWNYRVCRECRLPLEMDLANELLRSQALVRSVVASQQDLLIRHRQVEKEKELLKSELVRQQSEMENLNLEVYRLREDLQRFRSEYDALRQQNVELETRVQTMLEERDQAQQEVTAALDAMTELRNSDAAELEKARVTIADEQSERKSQSDTIEARFRQLRAEVQGLQLSNREWKGKFEEVRAERDELQFQWGFVARKLTDVGDMGVYPPKRVAGGFSSYPTPSHPNVELVVKWIVDYEAKRSILDAQQQAKTGQPKAIRRRLRFKLELMRVLAMSPRSQSRRLSTNGHTTGSRSPSKKASRSPSASSQKSGARGKATATLISEQISDVQPREGIRETGINDD